MGIVIILFCRDRGILTICSKQKEEILNFSGITLSIHHGLLDPEVVVKSPSHIELISVAALSSLFDKFLIFFCISLLSRFLRMATMF